MEGKNIYQLRIILVYYVLFGSKVKLKKSKY